MCRSIKTLRPPYTEDVTEEEVRAAALQYVRKISGFRAPDVVRTLRYRAGIFGDHHSAHTQAVMRGPSQWSVAERELFVQLLSVNGVGPKVALAVVSGSRASDLRRAIVLEDTARFQAIPGIGKKTAERIVLELKEKLAGDLSLAPAPGAPARDLVARDALVELGFTVQDAERALAGVDPELPAEERVRLALRQAA